jgi:hypothetical protein
MPCISKERREILLKIDYINTFHIQFENIATILNEFAKILKILCWIKFISWHTKQLLHVPSNLKTLSSKLSLNYREESPRYLGIIHGKRNSGHLTVIQTKLTTL